jgi:hypothetical protein
VQLTFAIPVHLILKYRANGKRPEIAKNISAALADAAKPLVLQGKKFWLGGLDSNQDNQIQNLMYCQLYDLPAGGNKKGRLRDPRYTLLSAPRFVNRGMRAKSDCLSPQLRF